MDISEDLARDYPPRLYAEGAYNLEKKKIDYRSYRGDFPTVRQALGIEVWQHLKLFPVGIVAKLADSEYWGMSKTVHYLLSRQLRVHKEEIWSLVVDQPIRFSLLEFGEITGLNTDPLPTEIFEPDQYKTFWEELNVPHGMGPNLDELMPVLGFCQDWSFEKRKWLGLLLLQAMGLYAMDRDSRIPFESAKRVFDDEAMKTYPWGRTAYVFLVDSIKTLYQKEPLYTINGLRDVLSVWAYESVTCFGERFGRVAEEQEIPLFRWVGTTTRSSVTTVLSEEIKEHGKVRVRKMVMKESLQDLFPHWPGEADDPQLVNLITDIHAGRFVRGFWDVQRNENKKRMKAEISSAAESPTKDKKIIKKHKNAEGKGATEEEEGREDMGNNAVLRSIMTSLKNISRMVSNIEGRFELRLSAYDSKFVNMEKELAELKKDRPRSSRRNHAGVKRKTITKHTQSEDDSDIEELASLDTPLPESDEDEEENIRSARINVYRERSVQLSSNGCAVMPAYVPSAASFPCIGDDGTTCMRKNFEPSAGIYDPLAPVDPSKLDKLNKHIEPFRNIPLQSGTVGLEFYRTLITERPNWPDSKYGWLSSRHIDAFIRVLIKRSMRNPSPFWSKRIAFIDYWLLRTWVRDYTMFRKKPCQFKFKDSVYEELAHGKFPKTMPTNLKWLEDVDHLYGAFNVRGNHWVAYHVDLVKEKIDCYDPFIGVVTRESEQEMLVAFRPLTQMIPVLMNDVIPANIRKPSSKQFAFRRRSDKYIPQNTQVGDCGVYALKFIECLALGVVFHGISDENILGLRVKMAADILDEGVEIIDEGAEIQRSQ